MFLHIPRSCANVFSTLECRRKSSKTSGLPRWVLNLWFLIMSTQYFLYQYCSEIELGQWKRLWECNIRRIHPRLSSSAKIEQLHACSHNSVSTHILDLHAWHQSLLTDHNNLWVIMEKLVVKPLSWKKVIQSNCTGTVCATWSTFHHRYYYTMISPSHNHPAGSTLKRKRITWLAIEITNNSTTNIMWAAGSYFMRRKSTYKGIINV